MPADIKSLESHNISCCYSGVRSPYISRLHVFGNSVTTNDYRIQFVIHIVDVWNEY